MILNPNYSKYSKSVGGNFHCKFAILSLYNHGLVSRYSSEERMDSVQNKKRTNIEGDRLSSLPNDLIYKILSFIDIKQAVQSASLSSRWRLIWTSLPYLNFSTEDFLTVQKFSKFVTHVLSGLDNQTEVYSVNLSLRETANLVCVRRILSYAFSHNLQQLTVSYLVDDIEFPLHFFCSRSLKHLRLSGATSLYSSEFNPEYSSTLASIWELPDLTTLRLDYITFSDDNIDIFSKCKNLKSLTLNHFRTIEFVDFRIYHPQLSSLTLENGHLTLKTVNVVAPQLENLCIRKCFGKQVISAPDLASLVYKSYGSLQFSADDLPSLESVYLCLYYPTGSDAREIVRLLPRFHNAKFLTLNLELIEILYSSMELISLQPSPFTNLKSLKIYPVRVYESELPKEKVTLPTEVKNYFLDGSPSASFTMVSHEDIVALRNAISAQNLMAKLRVMLEKENASSETSLAQPRKAPFENLMIAQPVEKIQLEIKERMTQITSCWEDLGVHIDQGRRKSGDIISKLRDIEVLLLKQLPASKRDKLQICFSSLKAEVESVVKKIIRRMKIQCDQKQSHLSDCIHELATTSQQSS